MVSVSDTGKFRFSLATLVWTVTLCSGVTAVLATGKAIGLVACFLILFAWSHRRRNHDLRRSQKVLFIGCAAISLAVMLYDSRSGERTLTNRASLGTALIGFVLAMCGILSYFAGSLDRTTRGDDGCEH